MRASEDQLKAWMIGGLGGDGASHAALLKALAPLLRAFYRSRLNSHGDDTEDLVQETLIAVHIRRASYDRTRAFTPWLFAIARYKLIDHLRRERRFYPLENFDHMLGGVDKLAVLSEQVTLGLIDRAISPVHLAL